jgi:monoamine oxidase
MAPRFAVEQTPAMSSSLRNQGGRFREVADYLILTIPFSVTRHVEVSPPLSARRHPSVALRRLGQIFPPMPAALWEEDERIVGGGSITDLPVRSVFIGPRACNRPRGDPGQLHLGGRCAGAASAEEHPPGHPPGQPHPPALAREVEAGGAAWSWADDPYSGGAFALFLPAARACKPSYARPHSLGG